jgi:hypothetical protein
MPKHPLLRLLHGGRRDDRDEVVAPTGVSSDDPTDYVARLSRILDAEAATTGQPPDAVRGARAPKANGRGHEPRKSRKSRQ